MGIKKWSIRGANGEAARKIMRMTNLTGLAAKLAAARGLDTADSLRAFFGEEPLSDPFLLADMSVAVACIRETIEEGGIIAVFGDYDCDGVTSAAMLSSYLEFSGAEVITFIPEREEDGYGLNEAAIRALHEQGVALIVTVDNGISAHREAALAVELGIKLVVTDHHQPGDTLPEAIAVVNPHRKDCPSPFKPLCGAGVALKLICAMEDGDWDNVLEQYGDLAALGTIADVVPLTGENRAIVQLGLRMLALTENPGLLALMEASNIDPEGITSERAAFGLVPRINAAGRFDKAKLAYALLTCEGEETAAKLAAELCSLNTARRERENRILEEIDDRIARDPNLLHQRVLILWGEGWHQGVLGIAAAKLVERYGKPVVLLSVKEDEAVGSARSVPGFPLHEALRACAEHLARYGGHAGAAGMTVEVWELEDFRDSLLAYAAKRYPVMPMQVVIADLSVTATDITTEQIEGLAVFEPFGEANPAPVFLLEAARLEEVYPVKEGRFARLRLRMADGSVYAICFDRTFAQVSPFKGMLLDLLVTLEINEYNGERRPSVRVRDLRPAGFPQEKYLAAKSAYEQLRRGEGLEARLMERSVPTREDAAAVYRLLRPEENLSVDDIYEQVAATINYCKLRLTLDVLEDLSLVVQNAAAQTVALAESGGRKAPFESSALLQRLRKEVRA